MGKLERRSGSDRIGIFNTEGTEHTEADTEAMKDAEPVHCQAASQGGASEADPPAFAPSLL
jgi:hypothetical protein